MKTLIQNQVVEFIKTLLISRLEKDFCGLPFRIFREKDLHACTYYHLRHFLKGDRNWEILNEPLLRNLKGKGKGKGKRAHPDIVLFHKGKPKLLIELKFNKKTFGIQEKDNVVLKKSVKNKKWAKKAFVIQTIIDPKWEITGPIVKHRNFLIPILMRENRIEKYLEKFSRCRKPKPRISK